MKYCYHNLCNTRFLQKQTLGFFREIRKLKKMLQPQKQLTFLDFMNVLHPVVCLSDFIHKITVQASPGLEKRRNSPDLGSGSSPSFGPRFRAIQCECSRFYVSQRAEKSKRITSLTILHAHTDSVATLLVSISKFTPFMCSQPPTHLFVFPFPCGPQLPFSLSPSLLCLSHTHPFPFSIVCSSPNII